MNETTEALIIAWAATAPADFVYRWWLHHPLRTRQPAVYEELGSPGVLFGRTLRERTWLTRFVFSSRSRYLNDPNLEKAVIFGRFLTLVSLLLACCWFYWVLSKFTQFLPE
ncbi:MAG TPA: hypothetical protein VGJ26_03955 [Pirellulales bacterium]|jgi:hypothetical protein